MPLITRTIHATEPPEQGHDVTVIQTAFLSLGEIIDPDELGSESVPGTYGSTTQRAVIGLIVRFDMDVVDFDFNASMGRLLHIAAAVESGNISTLKAAVHEAFAARQIAPAADTEELAWLARYATIARDFNLAREIVELLPFGFPEIESIIEQNALQPAHPELVNPENYYTSRYDYVLRSTITSVLQMTT